MTAWSQEGELNDQFADVVRGASEKLEGNFPGLKSLLEKLQDEQLGRAISRKIVNPIDASKHSYELEGYILPLNEEESEHLLVSRDGTMLVLQSYQVSLDGYRNLFSTSTHPYEIDESVTTEQIMQRLRGGGSHRVILDNKNLEDQSKFEPHIEKAVANAKVLKEKREQAKEKTVTMFMDKMGGLFGRPKPPSSDAPPPPPQASPPPTSGY